MSVIRHVRRRIAIGVDVGGTRLRLLAVEDGRPVGRLSTPAPRVSDLANFLQAIWTDRHWTALDVGSLHLVVATMLPRVVVVCGSRILDL